MRFLYSMLMYCLIPFIIIRLWWKGKKLPAYRQRIAERFYLGGIQNKPTDVWLHAVSLGEVIAAIPLIDAMLDKKWSIFITTMTPTGSERVMARFADKVSHQYIPYDLPIILKRFFNQIKPKVGIIMETELWPNLIYQADLAKIPLILANGRLSDDSKQGYKLIRFMIKPVLNKISAILAQGQQDAQRFIELGADKERVHVLGNIKFDLQTHVIDQEKYQQLKSLWGASRPVFIAASTHDSEESQILAQLKSLQESIPGVILLIAPRHPERFKAVYQLALESGFNTGLRSNSDSLSSNNEVVILDSLGELLGMYQLSDYAFVGGSLVPVGGHNVLEPIALGVPVISGSHVHNFKSICDDLEQSQGIVLVDNAAQVIQHVIRLYTDKKACTDLVHNANKVFEQNKGAVARHMSCIETLSKFTISPL